MRFFSLSRLMLVGSFLVSCLATSAAAEVSGSDSPTSPTIQATTNQELMMLNPSESAFLFEPGTPALGWRVVNDTVMGGLSSSTWQLTKEGVFVFSGSVSLENNGGFASVRSDVRDFGLADVAAFVLRVKGDGRTYQLRFRTDATWDGVAYVQSFPTVAGEWTEVVLPFEGFIPTWRGRIVSDAPPLVASSIRQVAWMIADKESGAFKLEVDWVKTRTDESNEAPAR